MEALVTALQGVLNFSSITANLASLIPVLGGVIVFSFTYRVIRKMIKGAPKGKVNL